MDRVTRDLVCTFPCPCDVLQALRLAGLELDAEGCQDESTSALVDIVYSENRGPTLPWTFIEVTENDP